MRIYVGEEADKCGMPGKSKKKRAIGEEKGINGQRKRQILVPDLSVKRKIEPYFWPFLLFYGHLWAIICELTAILRRIELFYNCFLKKNGQIWDQKTGTNGQI